MLAYTIAKTLELQRAVIERNMTPPDKFGGDPEADWQPLGDPVPCRFYWRKQSGRLGASKQSVLAQRTVALKQGGMLLPAGTDISDANDLNGDTDRIAAVYNVPAGTEGVFDPEDPESDPLVTGPLYVQAVFAYADHVEISWLSP